MAKKITQSLNEPQVPDIPYNALGHTAPFRKPEFDFRISAWLGKGGSGKTAASLVHLALAQQSGAQIVMLTEGNTIADSTGHTVIPYDLDPANPSLQRYLPAFPDHQVCGTIDVYEAGQLMQTRLLPGIDKGHHVLADIGAGAEVALLDWIERHELSAIIDGRLAFHVVLGSLDSVGTAASIAARSPGTPLLLYLNHKEPEHQLLINTAYGREQLESLLALPNIVGCLDFPDLRDALTICSGVSATLFDAMTHPKLTLIERQICRKALQHIERVWAPARDWFPW